MTNGNPNVLSEAARALDAVLAARECGSRDLENYAALARASTEITGISKKYPHVGPALEVIADELENSFHPDFCLRGLEAMDATMDAKSRNPFSDAMLGAFGAGSGSVIESMALREAANQQCPPEHVPSRQEIAAFVRKYGSPEPAGTV